MPNSGERKWKQSTITIDGVRRSDDGLYECQAENEGGRFYKSGHIQVGPKKGKQLIKKWVKKGVKRSQTK